MNYLITSGDNIFITSNHVNILSNDFLDEMTIIVDSGYFVLDAKGHDDIVYDLKSKLESIILDALESDATYCRLDLGDYFKFTPHNKKMKLPLL